MDCSREMPGTNRDKMRPTAIPGYVTALGMRRVLMSVPATIMRRETKIRYLRLTRLIP